jgi:hypothetical protein
LLNKEVDVHFVDNLHAKVFWGADGGAVIGSANLSENGMEDDRLIEAAVRLLPGDPSIEKFIASIHARAIGSKDRRFKTQLERLRTANVDYLQRNPRQFRAIDRGEKVTARTFGDWCSSKTPERWQLGWWTKKENPARDAAAKFSARHPGQQYETWLDGAKGELIKGVATLDVRLGRDPWGVQLLPRPYWWYPEAPIVSQQKNQQKFPYNWFARVNVPAGVGIPFDPHEKRFQAALAATITTIQNDILQLRGPVKGKFLDELKRNYAEA